VISVATPSLRHRNRREPTAPKLSLLIPSGRGASGDACMSKRSSRASICAEFRPLLRFVRLSSERTLEPVRQDGSFAEKQQAHPALLFRVKGGV
jgi:hypothetical protein